MEKIITVPNPLLRQKSAEVKNINDAASLVQKLKKTLIEKQGVKGVGLSAIQIGIPKKVMIAYSKASKKDLCFINPQITWYSAELTEGVPESKNKYEGCLSIPNVWAIIKRPQAIKMKYQTQSGKKQTRTFSGFTATIIQHEYDHLNGVLFVDRALEQGSKLYQLEKDSEGKEVLREIQL